MSHKIHPFKAYSVSGVCLFFSLVTQLLLKSWNIFITPKRNPLPIGITFHVPPSPWKSLITFCLSESTYSGYFMWMESYNMWFSVTVFSLCMFSKVCPCWSMCKRSLPFYGQIVTHYTKFIMFCLSIHQLMDVWIVSALGPLWIMLQCINFRTDIRFHFSWVLYLEWNCWVVLTFCLTFWGGKKNILRNCQTSL